MKRVSWPIKPVIALITPLSGAIMMDRRNARVAKNLQRAIGRIIDEELSANVLISVTRVSCDASLTKAYVYVSIYSNQSSQSNSLAMLKENSWLIRRALSGKVHIKRVPELLFVEDSSLQIGQDMADLMDRLAER